MSNAARNAAALLVERYDLTPPVPIEHLLAAEAEVREHEWPYPAVDAVLLRRPGQPPVVHYRCVDHRQRQRFTLAHEFGHLKLAWHLGGKACEIPTGDSAVGRTLEEREADTFASCLLVPDRWLNELTRNHGHNMSALLTDLAQANVSTTASLIAVRRALPIGWAFRINTQRTFYTSRGTIASPASIQSAGTAPALVDSRGVVVQAASAGWFIVSNSIGVMRPSPR